MCIRDRVSLDGAVEFSLKNKVHNGRMYVDQGIIAGCAGGGFENICDAADILRDHYIGADEFSLSVYPASTPIYMELAKNCLLYTSGRPDQCGDTVCTEPFSGRRTAVSGQHRYPRAGYGDPAGAGCAQQYFPEKCMEPHDYAECIYTADHK